MQTAGAQWIEISMIVVGAVGLLVLLAPTFGRKPKQTCEGWLFPVKLTCLLLYCLGFAAGIGTVTYAGMRLLASTARDWLGWSCFAIGFAWVLLVLSGWPAPLVFDRMGIAERDDSSSRIHWAELSHVRQYDIRNHCGIVIHSFCGKQLVITDTSYDSAGVLDALLEYPGVLLQSAEDTSGPISILTARLPRR